MRKPMRSNTPSDSAMTFEGLDHGARPTLTLAVEAAEGLGQVCFLVTGGDQDRNAGEFAFEL